MGGTFIHILQFSSKMCISASLSSEEWENNRWKWMKLLRCLLRINTKLTNCLRNECACLLSSTYLINFVRLQNLPLICLLCLITAAQEEERECAFTDQQQQWETDRVAGSEGRVSPENTTIRCAKGSHCFGLWKKSPPGEVRLVKQGRTCVTLRANWENCRE